jgi:hypothetical protein
VTFNLRFAITDTGLTDRLAPLATNGRDVDMILGYDAVVGVQGEVSGIRAA